MEKINCNFCGGGNDVEIYNNGDQIRVVICNDCSLVYLNPRPIEEDYKKYYSEHYQDNRHQIKNYQQAIERLERKNSYAKKEKRVQDFLKYINSNSRVFEVGAGWGTMLKVIKDKIGCYVSGVEISKLAVQVSKEYYGLNVNHQTFEEYFKKGIGEKFDFVAMVHVLEHFQSPSFILTQVEKIISDSGHLYIAVPNMANPDEPPKGFFRMEHCYYFTPLTIFNLLKKCGFKIIEIKIVPNDLRIIAAKKNSQEKEIDKKDFEFKYNKEKILRIINAWLRNHKLLQTGQKIMKNILPQKIFLRLKSIAIKISK